MPGDAICRINTCALTPTTRPDRSELHPQRLRAKMGSTELPVLSMPATAMTATTSDQQRSRRPRFWVGPLLAGACFALGYGITQRVVLMQQGWEKPQQATFRQTSFPGETLDGLRRRYGVDQPLMGDIAAKEAIDAVQRKANQEAEAIAKDAERRKQSQQAAAARPWAVTEEPMAEQGQPVAAPGQVPVDEVVPEPAPPTAVLTPSLDPLPAADVPAPDAPQPVPAAVVTPEPAVVQPRPAIDESLIFRAPPDAPPAP